MIYKAGYVYIVSNKSRTTLYIGVTSDLERRAWQHKSGDGSVFTKRYNCTDLIYYEYFDSIVAAISREKELKKWKRKWKDELAAKMNPTLKDLFEDISSTRSSGGDTG